MNIFLLELKRNIKSFVFWSLGLFFLLYAGMVKFTGISTDSAAMQKLFASWPRVILATFGMSNIDIGTLSGYYGVLFFYALIVMALYAIQLGVRCVGEEINDRNVDFIYSKPVSRTYIIAMKQLACVTLMGVFSVLSWIFSIGGIASIKIPNTIGRELLLLNVSLFVVGLIYFSIATCFAALSAKKGGLAANLLFLATYVFAILFDIMSNGGWIRPLSPIKYFDIAEVVNKGMLNSAYLVVSFALIVVLQVATYRRMNSKDL